MYIFDGAMGTMLQAAGLEEGYCPELFNVEKPEVVKNINAQYLQHGSDVITTNTFGACGLKLEDYDLQDRVREINIAAVKVAKDAIAEFKPSARVAGSMGPTGRFLQPLGNMSFDSIYDTYREQADALIEGGVDFIIIETIIDVQEMRAALFTTSKTWIFPALLLLPAWWQSFPTTKTIIRRSTTTPNRGVCGTTRYIIFLVIT